MHYHGKNVKITALAITAISIPYMSGKVTNQTKKESANVPLQLFFLNVPETEIERFLGAKLIFKKLYFTMNVSKQRQLFICMFVK